MTIDVTICRSCAEHWTRADPPDECPFCGSKVIVPGTATECLLGDECEDRTHDYGHGTHIEERA